MCQSIQIMEEICRLIEEGDVEQVITRLEHTPELCNQVNRDNRTLLQLIVQIGHQGLFHQLMERFSSDQLSLNHPDSAGWTVLHQVASLGWDLRPLLLHCPELELDRQTMAGTTALHYAAGKGHERAVEQLLNLVNSETFPHHYEGCHLIADQRGQTPIHRAATLGQVRCLSLILSRFPKSINDRDEDGNTPLHLASEENQIAAVNCLLEYGADPNIVNKEEKLPMINKSKSK